MGGLPYLETVEALQRATMDFQSRAQAANQAHPKVAYSARLIAELVASMIVSLESMAGLSAELRSGVADEWSIRNRMAGVYATVERATALAQRYHATCFKMVEAHDQLLTRLRNEGVALLEMASLLADKQKSLNAKRIELNDRIEEYNAAARSSFFGPLDIGLTHRRVELEGLGVTLQHQLDLNDAALMARMILAPIVAALVASDHLIQLQHGSWRLIGNDLDKNAELLGTGVGGREKWHLSPTYAAIQLDLMRDVAEKLAVQARPPESG